MSEKEEITLSEEEKIKKIKEIERLKKRIERLEKEVGENKEKFYEEKKEKKKYIKILIVLVVLMLIIDVSFLIFYFRPNFFSWKAEPNITSDNYSKEKKCVDGTPYGKCSERKPFYCYNGELLKNAMVCGCPEGYKIDFQDCKKI